MRVMRKMGGIYIFLLHILLVLMLVKSDFIDKVGYRLGVYNSPELSAYYDRITTYHSRMDGNVPKGATLFIGDSITQGLATSAITKLSVNYGIGSDTTLGVLNRIKVYKSINRAKAIVIAIGVNDLNKRGDEKIVSNFKNIFDLLPSDMPIILSAVLPVDEKVQSMRTKNIRISRLNELLLSLSDRYNNVVFMNAGSLLQGSDENLKSDLHVGDGVHLNTAGYKIWIEQIKTALNNRD